MMTFCTFISQVSATISVLAGVHSMSAGSFRQMPVLLLAAGPAPPARHVEGHGHEVADGDRLDVRALLDHLGRDLVSQHETGRRGRAAAHHVLVRAADVGGDDLEDGAVMAMFMG